ncbi:hypothetical protein [Litoreibacter roseus]|uniref:APCDD1 domain-containing protein n=1 Tax=Litoreibacter roseus TaxID=2601869 RepID=A0A6N6JMW1_9RHOB|nr:hypothetical protein [Litoreibacter roseus]GFE66809.1 hypothetical protein KIN_38830 [Litoreibacter roseus]
MKSTLTLACALASLAAESPSTAETTQTDLIGVWQTGLSEEQAPGGGPSAYLRQTTIFTETRQDIRAEIFADADGQMPIFTYASSGPYTPVGASDIVPGALNLELVNETSEVTIYMDVPDLMAAVGMGDCDLILNQAVDVRDCISGPPFLVTDCTDLDLVLVDEGGSRLRFGDQSVDRCISRPTELDDAQFFKVE